VDVLLIWGAALLVGLVVLLVAGYELLGHVRRTQRALAAATDELLPRLRALRPAQPGRHRAAEEVE
jgi:hypothetical protein